MIRFIVGLMFVFGGVGSIESNSAILPALVVIAFGLALMFWALSKFKEEAGL